MQRPPVIPSISGDRPKAIGPQFLRPLDQIDFDLAAQRYAGTRAGLDFLLLGIGAKLHRGQSILRRFPRLHGVNLPHVAEREPALLRSMTILYDPHRPCWVAT